jgi:hypothetical protein
VTVVPASVAPPLEEVLGERELRLRLALEASVRPELRLGVSELGPEALEGVLREPWLAEARALAEIEAERLRFFANEAIPPGAFSGLLDGVALERVRAALAFGPDHPLSASTLGSFGNCRFKGLLAHVLRLSALEEAGEDLDARTRGTFWHAVLRELFQAMGKAGLLGKGSADVPGAMVDAAIRAAVGSWSARRRWDIQSCGRSPRSGRGRWFGGCSTRRTTAFRSARRGCSRSSPSEPRRRRRRSGRFGSPDGRTRATSTCAGRSTASTWPRRAAG